MNRTIALALLASAGLSASVASAAPTDIGSGPASVGVVFNWSDGFTADYTLHYGTTAADTIGGQQASADVSSTLLPVDNVTPAAPNPAGDQNLALSWEVFSFGDLLETATYAGGHTDTESFDINDPSTYSNYWHEWIDDPTTGWSEVADSDLLTPGQSVGWVFGTENAPSVPEPATATIALAVGGVALATRRRRQP